MAIGDAGLTARIEREASATNQFKAFLSRYFYFCMSLVSAALVILGFSRTVNVALFHANPPRPLLLWMHGAAFSTWIVFFVAQSSLVRVRKVSVHRALGWFGAGLAAVDVGGWPVRFHFQPQPLLSRPGLPDRARDAPRSSRGWAHS